MRCTGDIRYLIDATDFTSGERATIAAAIERWEDTILAEDGTPLSNLTRVFFYRGDDPAPWTAPHVDPVIFVREDASLAVSGRARCEEREILLSDVIAPGNLAAITRHEMGHILGLAHTGSMDDLLGTIDAAMSTCTSGAGVSQRDVRIDDWGQARQKNEGGRLEANGNFETAPVSWWRNANLQLWPNSNGTTPSTGNKSLHFLPEIGQMGYVYTPIDFASSEGSLVRAQAGHRMADNHTVDLADSVRIKLNTRAVLYAAAEPAPACARVGRWPTNRSQNDRTYTGAWMETRSQDGLPRLRHLEHTLHNDLRATGLGRCNICRSPSAG